MKKTYQTLLALMLVLGLVLGMAAVAEAKTATRLTMSRRSLTMDWGTEITLSVVTTPTNASDRNQITWAEGADPADLIVCTPDAVNPRKAKVVVRGALPGEPYPTDSVTVTASTPGGKKATCVIRIDKVNVSKIEVTPSARTVYFTEAEPYATYDMATPKFTPLVAGDRTSYEWSSDNENVAVVDASGKVTFKAEGRAKITATYTASAKTLSDSCVFTVKPVRVKSVSIKKGGSTADVLYFGEDEDFTLSAVLTSAVGGKRPSYEKVTWTSSDSDIVEVGDSDGDDCEFTCKASGKVTITATAETGRYMKSASCTVYVRDDNPVRVTITAGGDCVLGGDPRKGVITARSTLYRYRELIKGNPGYPFEKISWLFNPVGPTGRANISIVNVEVCLTSKGGANSTTTRKFLFKGDPANAQALREAGIDIGNIANNHSADFGLTSFTNTADNIKKVGVEPSGYNRYGSGNYVPVEIVDGKRIGFYGIQYNQVPISLLQSRIQKVKADKDLDMLVLTIHWTGQTEYKRPVTSSMKAYARKAIDSGADVVIGHHRHELSGIEKYKGKYILYDLGSLVTGGGSSPCTCVVQLDFDISETFTETASSGGEDQLRIYPLYTTSEAAYAWIKKSKKYERVSNNWQPVPIGDAVQYVPAEGIPEFAEVDIAAKVVNYINGNSPGGVFKADSYIRYIPR